MAGLVVCRIATLFFGHDDRAALGAHDDFVFGLFKVAHVDRAAIASRSEQSGLVDQVGQVSAGKTGGSAGKYQGIYVRSEEHTSELQSLMRISYAVFCLKKK